MVTKVCPTKNYFHLLLLSCHSCQRGKKLNLLHYTPRTLFGRGYVAPTHALPRHYMGASCQRYAPAALYPGEMIPGTHWTGGWVGPRAGLDTEFRWKIVLPLPVIEPRSPGRPVRSQTLYCLSYPAAPATSFGTLCQNPASFTSASHYGDSGSIKGQCMWDLWLINWHRHLFLSQCSVFLLNLNSVNQLIFVMVKCGVLFEVRTGFLNNI
jgi:hypothetical protein